MANKVLKKAQTGTKVSVNRARQVADSLMNNSKSLKETAFDQIQMSKGIPYNKTGSKYQDIYGSGVSKTERASIANSMQKKASTDSSNSVRYKALADKAMKDAAPKKKMGGMIKRADGSYSKRGLWDNIRANKGSGKKPTAAMLKQEKKIKATSKKK